MRKLTIIDMLTAVGLCTVGVAVLSATGAARAEEPPAKAARADIYDRKADGNGQIAEAIQKAKRDHKRVLLQFGANWCGWCHKLHELCASNKDIAKLLQYEYEVVLIDVDTVDGKQHNADVNTRYGNPIQYGLPVLVVLDEEGKQLTTQETGALEEGDHHNPERVIEFLRKYKGSPPSAADVLNAALARAKSEKKNVFLYFSAPWCGWCHKLQDFLAIPDIKAIVDKAYVVALIDDERYEGGKQLEDSLRAKPEGIPFIVIMAPDKSKIADGNGEKGNIGYPVEDFEIAHFMKVFRQGAPGLGEADIKTVQDRLEQIAGQIKGQMGQRG